MGRLTGGFTGREQNQVGFSQAQISAKVGVRLAQPIEIDAGVNDVALVVGRSALDEDISQRGRGADDFNPTAAQDEFDPRPPGAIHGRLRTEDDAGRRRSGRGDKLRGSPGVNDARTRSA